MSIRRVIAWLLLLFILFFILTQPEAAAGLLSSIFDGITTALTALVDFFQSLA